MKIALVSFSPLYYDSRILRHAAALARAGHQVGVIAEEPVPDGHHAVEIFSVGGPRHDWLHRAGLVIRQAPASLVPASAHVLYWLSFKRQRALSLLRHFSPDLVIANDWKALPVACSAKSRQRTAMIYDSHEFAAGEFDSSFLWRMLAQNHAGVIERTHIKNADAVMTVSDGLARRLHDLYGLPDMPSVIRNVPDVQPHGFSSTGDKVELLYQGIIAPRRGLENLIDSVLLWPENMCLVLRGPDIGGARAELEARPGARTGRVRFAEPVPPHATVQAAAQSDIGVFLMDTAASQGDIVLPNKLFEYMLAGLAVMVSDLPEMRRVVTEAECGIMLADGQPQAIADAVKTLTRERVDGFKQASVKAASAFAHEVDKLPVLVDRVMTRHRAGKTGSN